MLVYKLHESKNVSNTLTMYPWHLAKATSQFYTGKHNTFYPLVEAMFLRGLLHSLLQGGEVCEIPELHRGDPESSNPTPPLNSPGNKPQRDDRIYPGSVLGHV